MKKSTGTLGLGLAAAALVATAGPVAASPYERVVPKTMFGHAHQGTYDDIETPAMGTQSCDPANNPDAPRPHTGLTWSFFNPEDVDSGLSADVTITTWQNSRRAFKDVVNDTGQCRFFEGAYRVNWPGQNPRTHALFIIRSGSLEEAVAVIRDGQHLLSVVVADWNDNGNEVAGAKDQALQMSARL